MPELEILKTALTKLKAKLPLLEKFRAYRARVDMVRPESLHLFLHDCCSDVSHVAMMEEIAKLDKIEDIESVKTDIKNLEYRYFNLLHETAMDKYNTKPADAGPIEKDPLPSWAYCLDPCDIELQKLLPRPTK
jgi:hypothetical protein